MVRPSRGGDVANVLWHNYFKPVLFVAVICVWALTWGFMEYGFGIPVQALSHQPIRFLPHPKRVGILYPLLIKTHGAISVSSLYHDITLEPRENFVITPQGPHEFALHPTRFWPDSTTIDCVIHDQQGTEQTVLHTDDGKVLRVDLTTQTMEAYEDETLVRVMPVSTGTSPRWTTPTGTFYIFRRVLDDHMQGGEPGTKDYWDVHHVPYAQYIYRGIAIHGAWWNNHFGIPRSHGCIQLSTRIHNPHPQHIIDNAKWVWDFADLGTPVIIFGQTPQNSSTPLSYPEE